MDANFKFEIGETIRLKFGVSSIVGYVVRRSLEEEDGVIRRIYGIRQTNVNGINGAIALQFLYAFENEIERLVPSEADVRKDLVQ